MLIQLLKYCIKILFLLIIEYLPLPLLDFVLKAGASLFHPKPDSVVDSTSHQDSAQASFHSGNLSPPSLMCVPTSRFLEHRSISTLSTLCTIISLPVCLNGMLLKCIISHVISPPQFNNNNSYCLSFFFFSFFLVLPLYCLQPISLHPRAHMLSHVTPWTATRQAPLSMDFSRQEYWSGLPFPSPITAIFCCC